MAHRSAPKPRTADPYRDLGVIDARAPRFNQGFVGLLALASVATGAWPLLAVPAAQLAVSLALGRRWCLPCRLYFDVVQPRLGEGPLEDSRPVKFANQLGLAFLAAALAAHLAGAGTVGAALAALVAGLALLAAATGFCAGCVAFQLLGRLRGAPACTTCVVPGSATAAADRRTRPARP